MLASEVTNLTVWIDFCVVLYGRDIPSDICEHADLLDV